MRSNWPYAKPERIKPKFTGKRKLKCEVCGKGKELLFNQHVMTEELVRFGRPEGLIIGLCGVCALNYSRLANAAYWAHEHSESRAEKVALVAAARKANDEAMNG